MVRFKLQHFGSSRWRRLWLVLVLAVVVWIVASPVSFVNLWLTPDQQGRLWFKFGDYERASRTFEDPRWKGFSLYAGEDFATAERYFSQYQDAESLLARANALAHQRKYDPALRAYEELAKRYPDHPAPAVNIAVVEAVLEAAEGNDQNDGQGDSNRKPGDGTQSSDGEGEQGTGDLEQLSAEQLLQDPGLTEMWLRQIQRDPAEFLTTKFYLQLSEAEKEEP